MRKTISAGSYSRLDVFGQCKLRAKLAFIDKVSEAERPDLPGGREHANIRGNRIHDYCEDYVRGKKKTQLVDMKGFEDEFKRLKELYKKRKASVLMEDMWLYDKNWMNLPPKTPKKKIWMRIKIDTCIFLTDGKTAIVIDYKTGQMYHVKHHQQTQLYQLAVFLRYPHIEKIITELWYLDLGELVTYPYTRKQGLSHFNYWNNQAVELTTIKKFPPNPNAFSCRFCPYKTGVISKKFRTVGTGDCNLNPS